MSTPADMFSERLGKGDLQEAMELWFRTPALQDMNGSGRDAIHAAIFHAPALLTLMIPQMQHFRPDHFSGLGEYAVQMGRPQALRVLLTLEPNLVRGHPRPDKLLSEAYVFSQNKAEEHRESYEECFTLLIKAGALNAVSSEHGMTPLMTGLKGSCDYSVALVRQGADICARSRGGFTIDDISNGKMIRSIDYIENYKMLMNYVDSQLGQLNALLSKTTPCDMLLSYEEGHGAHTLTHIALSAGRGDLLADPAYWRKHGGADAAVAFTVRLAELIPDYLAYMRGRFDCSALLRDEALPREGSVTVEYARGSASARGAA